MAEGLGSAPNRPDPPVRIRMRTTPGLRVREPRSGTEMRSLVRRVAESGVRGRIRKRTGERIATYGGRVAHASEILCDAA